MIINSKAKISSANEANLIEDSGRVMGYLDTKFDLGPYEIKTPN